MSEEGFLGLVFVASIFGGSVATSLFLIASALRRIADAIKSRER